MKSIVKLFFFTTFVLFAHQNLYADVCTPLARPTKYIAKKGDHIAEILRTFKLEPVFGKNSRLEKLLQVNNLTNPDLIAPGDEITLPFACEEQTNGWRILDRGVDRLITLESIALKTKLPAPIAPVVEPPNKAVQIIESDVATGVQNDTSAVEMTEDASENISEALRYRMICDGEWTGSECITRYSAVYLLGGAWYNRYDSVDATTKGEGTLLSKLNPEIGIGWHNYWFENFRTNLGLSYMNNEIHPEVRERPIEQNKKNVTSVFADARYETGRFGFGFGIQQTEKLFYRFTKENIVLFDDGGVTVNAVPILIFRGSLSYMLHQTGKYRFDTELGFSSLQGATTSGYEVKQGTATDIAISLQHDRVKEYFFATLKYEQSKQDTQILLQSAQELGIRFGYAWKLKDW